MANPALPALPPVQAEKIPSANWRDLQEYPYSLTETSKYYAGTDPDLIWGPYYKRFRAARKERRNWNSFTIGAIWDGIPAAAQSRPGRITRFFNWIADLNPPPSLPLPDFVPGVNPPPEPNVVDDWKNHVNINEDWSPSRIDFARWYGRFKHPENYDDEFFRANYRTLYERLCTFCETWFGAGINLTDFRDNLDDADVSPWEIPMTEQFIEYVGNMAHEDRGYTEWKDILDDPRHRKWLCVGVFAQIIERNIFNALLFGASDALEYELGRHDRRWALQEGFTRKDGRRQLARADIGERLIPDKFWEDVDDLAGQTVLIFQPLFTLMCLATNRVPQQDGAVFWQEIHTILALAGYFQVCMTVSPGIFHILSASPGARYSWEEEAHADRDLYELTKNFHASHNQRWDVLAQLSASGQNDQVQQLINSLPDGGAAEYYMPLPANEDARRAARHQRQRGGKVMYAVFPKLTRYTAENVGDPVIDVHPHFDRENLNHRGEGMAIAILQRASVVYYQGLVHAPADMTDGRGLDEHLGDIAWSRMRVGFLPYEKYFWDKDGLRASYYDWPVWPERLNPFWFYWILSIVVTQVIDRYFGPAPAFERQLWYQKFMYQPLVPLIRDPLFYTLMSMTGFYLGRGHHMFWQIQALNFLVDVFLPYIYHGQRVRFFAYFAGAFLWLDEIVFRTFPNVVLAALRALRADPYGGLSFLFRAVGFLFQAIGFLFQTIISTVFWALRRQ
ncbi:hypothetical protein F4777DRAFT_322761 [Nemania sp. FL0916]|nr:hypothetical protein F4777DRAFT_322761 [Nemania sp. FL0916]